MKDLTKGNIYKTFFLFGLPLVLAGVLTQAYSIINSVKAGKFLGETGLAVTGATAPLDNFVNSVFWGFGVGFAVYLTRLFSSKEYGKLKQSFFTCYIIIAVLLIIVEALLVIFYNPLEKVLKIDETIQKDTFIYFFILRFAQIFVVLNTLAVSTLNGMGITGYTFLMSLTSSVINIVGNILSIVALDMGVAGIALASILATSAVHVGYMIKIARCFKELNVEKKILPNVALMKPGLSYGLPNMVQQASMWAVGLLMSPLINGMGVEATASYAVVMQIYNFIAAIFQNSSKTVSNYVAQCVGAKQTHKIKRSVGVGLLQNLAFALPFILICAIFYKPVCGLFFKANASDLSKTYAYDFARIYLPFIVFSIVCNLFHGFYRGAKAMRHLFFVSVFGALVRYVASVILINKMGMDGFYLGWVISWIVEAIVNIGLFSLGKWKPKLQENNET